MKRLKYQRSFSILGYLAIFLFALVLTTKANAISVNAPSCQPNNAQPSDPPTAKIKSINSSSEQSVVQIQCYQDGHLFTKPIAVKAPELKASLESFEKGDQIALTYNSENELQSLSVVTHEVQWFTRIITISIAFLILLFLFWFLLGKGLYRLTVGLDNRYSNSKTQIVLWFFILMTTYLACISLRGLYGGIGFFGGVSIPQNLLAISGLSAFTFVTAKGITQSKLLLGQEKEPAKKPSFPDDLFRDDKQNIDLGDFQMIVVTLVAVIVYLAEVLGFLGTIELHKTVTLPDVDTTILTTFGLGQGAYLVKKYIDDVVVKNPSPTTPDVDTDAVRSSSPSLSNATGEHNSSSLTLNSESSENLPSSNQHR